MSRTRRTNVYRWYRPITTFRRRKLELRAIEQLRECGYNPSNRSTAISGSHVLPQVWDDLPVAAWDEIRPWLLFHEAKYAKHTRKRWVDGNGKQMEPCCYVHRSIQERRLKWRKVPLNVD